jgi:hypothetical protein
MSSKIIVLFVLALRPVTAADESLSVRNQEAALAKAMYSKDETALLSLTDKDFSLHLSCGWAVKNYSADVLREQWIVGLKSLRGASYKASIDKVELGRGSSAQVTIHESWVVVEPHGNKVRERFITNDLWVKFSGSWKLVSRLRSPSPRDCKNAPDWASRPW